MFQNLYRSNIKFRLAADLPAGKNGWLAAFLGIFMCVLLFYFLTDWMYGSLAVWLTGFLAFWLSGCNCNFMFIC